MLGLTFTVQPAEVPETVRHEESPEAYVERLQAEAGTHEFLDLGLAEALGKACLRLLERLDDAQTNGPGLIQAAVQYFVLEEDAEDDLSVAGFDDDAEVFNAVVRHLGWPELAVEVA